MRSAVFVLFLVLLTGCSGSNEQSVIRDRQLDYQAAYVEPKLKIPEELSNERVTESLKIPGVNEPTAGLYGGSFEPPRAEAVLRNPTQPMIRRYQIGNMHWLSIPEAPSAVWPEFKRFFVDNGLMVGESEKTGQIQSLTSNTFEGRDTHSGSRIIRYFAPEAGKVALRLLLEPGLRTETSEVRLIAPIGDIDQEVTGHILDEFKYHLIRNDNEGKAFSRILGLVEPNPRMKIRRIEGLDELVIDANISRVFSIIIDIVKDLGAVVTGGDLEKGLLNIQYVRKITESRLGAMSLLNRSIATAIDNPVGSFQVQMIRAGEGLIVRVIPTGKTSSIAGANELIQEFQERLY